MIINPNDISLFYVPPFNDESLTSWIYRLSNSHFCDFQTYLEDRLDLNLLKSIDFDINPDKNLLYEFARYTPLESKDLLSFTLNNDKLSGFKKLIDRKFVPWLLPISKKSVRTFGLQICPSCWSRDKIAYHRLHWRLSIFFFCPECMVYLKDHCSFCDHPIVCYHPEYPNFEEDPLDALRFCFNCRKKLMGQPVPLSSSHKIIADRVLNLMYGNTNLPCSNEDHLTVLHYFSQRAFSEYQRQNNRLYPIQKRNRSQFLEVNSITRANLIAEALEMFDEFPEIITKSKRNHLSVKAFWKRGFVEPPKWYFDNL
jgi:hypothetical protein